MASTIYDFRRQHPEYDDLDDETLTQRLHAKHYADMDYNAFRSKFFGRAEVSPSTTRATDAAVPEPGGPQQMTVTDILRGGPASMAPDYEPAPDSALDTLVKRSGARLTAGLAAIPELAVRKATDVVGAATGATPEEIELARGLGPQGAVEGGARKTREAAQRYEQEAVAALPENWRRATEMQFVERDERGELQFGEGARTPEWYAVNAIDMGMMMAPGIGAAGLAGRSAYIAKYAEVLSVSSTRNVPQSVAIAAARQQAERAAARAAMIAGGISEGGVAGGMNAQQVRETLNQIDEETLMQYEPYRGLRTRGLSHEAARDRVASDQAIAAGVATAIVTGATGAPLNALIGKFAAGGRIVGGERAASVIGKVAERGKAAGKVAGIEGATEFVQEGFDQLAQNLAEQPITGQETWAGVLESAITGGALGALLGGGMGAAAGPEGPKVDTKTRDLDRRAGELAVARENYAALMRPEAKITHDQVTAAKDAYETALVAYGEEALRSGVLPANEQQALAQALQQARKGKDREVAEQIPGAVRPAPAAPEGGKKPAKAEALSEFEEGRLDALNRVATADTVEGAVLTDLVSEGMARVNPQTGRALLLPAGKRQLAELRKRSEAAEAAEKVVAEKQQPKPTQKQASVAKKPQPAGETTAAVLQRVRAEKAAKAKAAAAEPDLSKLRRPVLGLPTKKKPAAAFKKAELDQQAADRRFAAARKVLDEGKVLDLEKFTPGTAARTSLREKLERAGYRETSPGHWRQTRPVRDAAPAPTSGPLREPTAAVREIEGEQETLVGENGKPLKPGDTVTRTFFTKAGGETKQQVKVLGIDERGWVIIDQKSLTRSADGTFENRAIDPEQLGASWKPTVTTPTRDARRLTQQIAREQREEQEAAEDIRQIDEDIERQMREERKRQTRERLEVIEGGGPLREPTAAVAPQADRRQTPTEDRGEQERRAGIIAERQRVLDRPVGARDAAQAVADAVLARPGQREAVARQTAANRARIGSVPETFKQDNPAVRGEERGKQWLAGKQRDAEEDAAGASTRIGSRARMLTGATTAWADNLELPVSEVAKLKGVMGENRRPGDEQYDAIMRSVYKNGWQQDWPIMIFVNHKGEAFIHEGNTRTAVARDIGQETIKAEVRWYNGGEMAAGDWSPAKVAEMVGGPLQEPAAAVAAPAEGEPLLAPNGRPSKLSRAQWEQVRTPEFKAWFGDWEKFALLQGGVWNDGEGKVSKVVDRDTGEPLVVYRGIKDGSDGRAGVTTGRYNDRAFFTSDFSIAHTYSGTAEEPDISVPTDPPEGYYVRQDPTTEDGTWLVSHDAQGYRAESWGFAPRQEAVDEAWELDGGLTSNSGIYAVFLNIRRPHEADFEGANWDGSRLGQWAVVKADEFGETELVYDEQGNAYFEDRDEAFALAMRTGGEPTPASDHYETTNSVADEAKRYGDGAIIRKVVDNGPLGGSWERSDVFVIFDDRQAKSATQNTGAFNPNDPRLAASIAPAFYSALTRAAENAKITKGTAAQWYGALKNTPGVKSEELDWSGVKEWLGDRKSVTKEDVLSYLRANELKIDELLLVPPKIEFDENSKYYAALAGLPFRNTILDRVAEEDAAVTPRNLSLELANDREAYEALTSAFPELIEDEDWKEAVLLDLVTIDGRKPTILDFRAFYEKQAKSTRFAERQMPGGAGYKMLLIQLPDPTPRAQMRDLPAVRESGGGYYAYDRDNTLLGIGSTPEAARESARRNYPNTAVADTYRSPHYPEDRNVVAHVRFNERTDAEGRSYIFLETVQSDWHQEGRSRGYLSELPAEGLPAGWELKEIVPTSKNKTAPRWWLRRRGAKTDSPVAVPPTATFAEAVEQVRIDFLMTRIPDAPFKTTWPELVMKRMIRYAAENGFDGIGWTTGQQQSDRWGAPEEGMAGFYDEILVHAANKIGKKYGARVNGDTDFGDSRGPDFTAHGMILTPELKTAALGGFPMFARPQHGPIGPRVSYNELRDVRDRVERELGVRANIVMRQDLLPERLIPSTWQAGRTIAGVYEPYTGSVWLVAEHLRSPEHAYETALHEVVGHKGLRGLLGTTGYDDVMDEIIAAFPNEVMGAAKKNGIDINTSRAHHRLAAEELVAYSAGALLSEKGGTSERSVWKRIMDMVRAALRKLGFLQGYTAADIDQLIYRARDHIRRKSLPARAAQMKYEAAIEMAADSSTAAPYVPESVNDGPLLGMPTRTTIPGVGEVEMGPFAPARAAAARYRKRARITTPEVRTYARVSPETGRRIADAYQKMKHDPLNPRVRDAYKALAAETLAQYQEIKRTGLVVEFIQPGQDPYAASPRLAIEDVRNNNHLWVFPTNAGFGMDENAEYMKNNPLLAETDEYVGTHRLVVNDVFRIVHDYFGHIQEGNGFRADGEENAWRIHASMYSPLARSAMTTETRGQNSWLNWGPFGDKNRRAKSADTVYAEQKIGLLPPEFWDPEPEIAPAMSRVTPLAPRALARLARQAFEAEGSTGFALNIYGEGPPAIGYMLSADKTSERTFQTMPTVDDITAYVNEYRERFEQGAHFLGGWIAEQNRYVLDTSIVVHDHEEAITAAREAQQEAIYDLAGKRVEPVSESTFSMASPADARVMFATANDEVSQTITRVAHLLMPEERSKLNRATAQKLVDMFDALPDVEEMADVALAGQSKRGWYRDAAEVISDIFGPDAPRFAALLAALSPQAPVDKNLDNAVRVWTAWDKAGRPTDRKAITKIMGANLWNATNRRGETVGVLPAWIPNTVRALTFDNPEAIVLSGPKVSSFAANLRGQVHEVTLDAWMAAFALLDQKGVLSGRMNVSGTDPGKRSGYLAYAARIRETANYLTKKTKQQWTPAEVQETIWAWTKTLTEQAEKYGSLSSAVEIVKDKELTNDLINSTTDFATLFAQSEHQQVLRAAGYGEQLDRALGRQADQRRARRQTQNAAGRVSPRVLNAAERIDQFVRSRRTVTPQDQLAFSILGGNTGNPDLDSFLSKIGGQRRTLGQWWQDTTENLSARAQMAVFDDLYGIKRAGDLAGISAADVGFKNAHLAKSAAELTQALIEYGYPVWLKDGQHEVAGIDGGQGLIDILRPLGNNVNLWAAWMVARRADRLAGEGRENLFLPNEIAAAKDLDKQHPEFKVVADRYAEFQKKVLDFAQEAGIIDPESRVLWEHADYIPFYRLIENGQVQGPNAGGPLGKVRNQIRRLRGGRAQLGDPLENIARNWHSLMDASLKAHAARKVVDALNGTGMVTRAPQVEFVQAIIPAGEIKKFIKNNPALVQTLKNAGLDVSQLPAAAFNGLQKMLAVQPPSGEDIISVWRNGKREYWHVHDDLLFESLMNVNKAAWGPLMEFFRFPKRLGTATITSTLSFGVKNFWRDMWHSFIQGAVGRRTTITPGLDSVKGLVEQLREGDTMQALLAGGGSFTHGYIRGGDTRGAAATIRRSIRKIDPSHAVLDTPAKVWRFYRDLLNAAENSHRVAIYRKMLTEGASRLDATYEARDLLDFAKHGNNSVVRFLTESVMFLNARAQGLYRLGRGSGGSGKVALSILMRGALYTTAVLALLVRQYDDERYKALTDADKAAYLHFFDVFQEGDHYRLPVPFEVGTIFGTVPMAIFDAFKTNADEPDRFRQSWQLVAHAFSESLNMSPDIQVVWPIIELGINRDTFTGSPVLTMGDEAVLPEEQDSPGVSPTIRALARAMPDFAPEELRSPKQLQHLARGYMGNVQDYVLAVTDVIARKIAGEPAPAERTLRDYPDIKAFVQSGPQRQTKYGNTMYEIAEEAEKVHATILRLEKLNTPEADLRIEALEAEHGQLLDVRKDFSDAVSDVNDIRREMRAIQIDPDMAPEEKRKEIDALYEEVNEIARDVWGLRPGSKLNPDIAVNLIDKTPEQRAKLLADAGFAATAEAMEQLG